MAKMCMFIILPLLLINFPGKINGSSAKNILHLLQQSAERKSLDSTMICQTLILAHVENSWMVEAYSAMPNPYVVVELQMLDVMETTENQSYFYKELQAQDILSPSHFPAYHFIPQCSVLLLEANLPQEFEFLLEIIMNKKMAKSHRDYFVFIGEDGTLQNFFRTKIPTFIAFKFALLLNPPKEGTSKETTDFIIQNFCDESAGTKPSQELLLYEQKCRVFVKGQTITVAAVAGQQFGSFINNPDGSLKSARGIYYLMLNDCGKRMNFTIRMYRTSGSGSRKQGQWSGGMGELFSRRADVAFPISIIEPRNAAIDYSPLLAWFEKVFWVKAPPLRTTARSIIQPFTLGAWLSVGASIGGCTFVFFAFIQSHHARVSTEESRASDEESLTSGVSRRPSDKNSRNDQAPSCLQTLSLVLGIIVRILLEQSTFLRAYGGFRIRFGIAFWAVFCMIIGTGYRSKLFFFLTFLQSDPVPRTHAELAYSDYTLYFRTYGGVAYRYMIQSEDPIHKAMVRDGRLKLETTTVGCIKRVFTEEKAACMDYGFSGDYIIFTNATLYAEADPKSSRVFRRSKDVDGKFIIIWAFRKYSPLTVVFNNVVSWMHASGMYDRWVYDDWNEGKLQGIRYLKGGESLMRINLERLERDLSVGPKPLTGQTLMVPFLALLIWEAAGAGLFGWEILRQRPILRSELQCVRMNFLLLYAFIVLRVFPCLKRHLSSRGKR